MPWVAAIVGGVAATGGSIGQAVAGQEATSQQQGAIDKFQTGAKGRIGTAFNRADRSLRQGQEQFGVQNQLAQGTLGTGAQQGIASLQQGFGGAGQTIGAAGAQGRTDLQGGFGAGQGTLSGLGGLAAGQESRVGQFFDQGFQADPGFQFRQQQGEQAINRMNAAQGGRFSGAAAKELASFNQGLASQEAQQAFQRAQSADILTQQRTQQQLNIGSQLAGMQAQAGQSLAGLGMNVGSQQAGFQAQQGQGIAGLQFGAAQQQAGLQSQLGAQQLATQQQLGASQIARMGQLNEIGMMDLGIAGQGAANNAAIAGQIHGYGAGLVGQGLGGIGGGGGEAKTPATMSGSNTSGLGARTA